MLTSDSLQNRRPTLPRSFRLSLSNGRETLRRTPPFSLNRDMLLGATISSVSSPQYAELGTRAGSVSHIRFVQKDSSIVMQAVNSELLDALPTPMARKLRLLTIVTSTSIPSQSRLVTRKQVVSSSMPHRSSCVKVSISLLSPR